MTDSEPNQEHRMDSSAPQRDAGQIRAWDQGTPAGESGPRPSGADVKPGTGRAPDFDPGPGWRMVPYEADGETRIYYFNAEEGYAVSWIRTDGVRS